MRRSTPGVPPLSVPPLVLIVDDDADLRAYVRQGLEALPVCIAEAHDGDEALARLAAHPGAVALVITDLLMEPTDGRVLKQTLHRDPRWAHVPVLLVTGEQTRPSDRPVLSKPFNTRQLRSAVRSLLDAP